MNKPNPLSDLGLSIPKPREGRQAGPGKAAAPDGKDRSTTLVTVRDAVLDLLRRRGMTTIFGNPGSTELPMFRDFPADFRYLLGLQESVVIGMADGFAQARGTASFVNLHSAVGVGHAMGAIFTAHKNRTPMVITAGQQARSILPFEPFLHSGQATDLPKPYVKWACEPARAEDVPLAIERAWHIAMQEPRGPTLVSVPVDDWDRLTEPLAEHEVGSTQRADPGMLERIGAWLDAARSPVFVSGAATDRGGAWEAIVALAERHEARVFEAPMAGRAGFPQTHRLFAGHLPAMRERIVDLLAGHDLVVAIGAPAFTYHVEGEGPHLPPGARLAQIIEDPGIAAWTPGGISAVGNVRLALEELLRRPAPPARAPVPGRARPSAVPTPAAGEPLSPAYVFQTLAALRQPDDVIVEEVPTAKTAMHAYLPHSRPGSYQAMCSGGLGFAMAAAVGIGLADTGRKVIGVIGDGSSMYTIQALWTAAREQVPVTFLILNNRRYAALEGFARLLDYRADEPVAGTVLGGIDFAAMARAQGVPGARVSEAAGLAAALEQALRAPGPYLLEIEIQ